MNFMGYWKSAMGIGMVIATLLFNSTTMAMVPDRQGSMMELQGDNVDVDSNLEEQANESIVQSIIKNNGIMNTQINRKEKLSPREAKLAKLAERARKNAEEKRLKKAREEAKVKAKEAKEAKKKKDRKKTKDKRKNKSNNIENRINAILEEYNKTQEEANVVDYGSNGILGQAVVTKEQALRYLLMRNPHPKLTVSPEEIVEYYYEEASLEGIRPDAAFAQALKETGNFNYGGTVTPDQNNYCGLGTTSATIKGAYFPSARMGVRAHIQHLLAYASLRPPRKKIVDPRYMLVRAAYSTTTIDTWQGLNGRWAVPGNNYGQEILEIVSNMAKM